MSLILNTRGTVVIDDLAMLAAAGDVPAVGRARGLRQITNITLQRARSQRVAHVAARHAPLAMCHRLTAVASPEHTVIRCRDIDTWIRHALERRQYATMACRLVGRRRVSGIACRLTTLAVCKRAVARAKLTVRRRSSDTSARIDYAYHSRQIASVASC